MRDPLVRADEARHILESDIWKEAWEAMHERLRYTMLEVPASDTNMHSRLIDGVKVLEYMRQHLEGAMAHGVSERERRKHMKLRKQKLGRAI